MSVEWHATWREDVAVLRDAGLFDPAYYLANNPDIADSNQDPLEHFCRRGWRELRSPRPGFDLWWYWLTHLDPASDEVNPLVHYVLEGRELGLDVQPIVHLRPGLRYAAGQRPRRICLFAGYDRDGMVDDYVVEYVRELSRSADVYYLADCHLPRPELDKLAGITQGAWAIRHGGYDFGSWSILARELVGWDRIDGYDELLLVNDSCYLLRPLDEVFAEMDASVCDWWGLQATKGLASTREAESNQFTTPIPIETVKADYLDGYLHDPVYDFHLGSYFLLLRRPVLDDDGFRTLLDAVRRERSKLSIIRKYEIGLTHYLTGRGYDFDTYIDDLLPFHPLFTESHFDLISRGFPLLKKYFIYQNHYDTPDLVRWKERVLELVPEAPVEMFERDLLRTSPDDRLRRSFSITTRPDGVVHVPVLLDPDELDAEDQGTPTFDHWWAFPVSSVDHSFTGSTRAVFEAVRQDPSIKKVVLTRSRRIKVDGANVVVVPLLSPEGQQLVVRCRQVIVANSPRTDLPLALSKRRHNFVSVRNGIPVRRFGRARHQTWSARVLGTADNRRTRAVVTTSDLDALAALAGRYPLTLDQTWRTGLPRHDFVLMDEEALPEELAADLERLRALVDGRRLVLFLPGTTNGEPDSYYRFDDKEIGWLAGWCERSGAVLGVREPSDDPSGVYAAALERAGALDLGATTFPHVEVLYRLGAALVTDYSGRLIDFLATGRPVVAFAHLPEREDDELLYDLETIVPGPVARTFDQLCDALERLFDPPEERWAGEYAQKRGLFLDHLDPHSAGRVVRRVKELYR